MRSVCGRVRCPWQSLSKLHGVMGPSPAGCFGFSLRRTCQLYPTSTSHTPAAPKQRQLRRFGRDLPDQELSTARPTIPGSTVGAFGVRRATPKAFDPISVPQRFPSRSLPKRERKIKTQNPGSILKHNSGLQTILCSPIRSRSVDGCWCRVGPDWGLWVVARSISLGGVDAWVQV